MFNAGRIRKINRMGKRSRPSGLFVTGTDTGVGKTLVAAAVASLLRSKGMNVGVMKPVASGGVRVQGVDRLVSEDAVLLADSAKVSDDWALINPICFRKPIAPLTAARLERRPVRLAAIRQAFDALCARHDIVIVEGVGGWLVPLTARLTTADMARAMDLPVLVVSRPLLGTMNHTMLTIESIRRHRLAVFGLVFNEAVQAKKGNLDRLIENGNVESLPLLCGTRLIGRLPYARLGSSPKARIKRIGALSRYLDRDSFDDLFQI